MATIEIVNASSIYEEVPTSNYKSGANGKMARNRVTKSSVHPDSCYMAFWRRETSLEVIEILRMGCNMWTFFKIIIMPSRHPNLPHALSWLRLYTYRPSGAPRAQFAPDWDAYGAVVALVWPAKLPFQRVFIGVFQEYSLGYKHECKAEHYRNSQPKSSRDPKGGRYLGKVTLATHLAARIQLIGKLQVSPALASPTQPPSTDLPLSALIAGPFVRQLLGKLSRLDHRILSELLRGWSELEVYGTSPWFQSLARNKKSVSIDMRKEKSRALVRRLAERSDVAQIQIRCTNGLMYTIGRPDPTGAALAKDHHRIARGVEVEDAIMAWMSERTRDDVRRWLDPIGVPQGASQVRERGAMQSVWVPGQAHNTADENRWMVRMPGVAPRLQGVYARTRRAGRDPGAHNEEIMCGEFGLDPLTLKRWGSRVVALNKRSLHFPELIALCVAPPTTTSIGQTHWRSARRAQACKLLRSFEITSGDIVWGQLGASVAGMKSSFWDKDNITLITAPDHCVLATMAFSGGGTARHMTNNLHNTVPSSTHPPRSFLTLAAATSTDRAGKRGSNTLLLLAADQLPLAPPGRRPNIRARRLLAFVKEWMPRFRVNQLVNGRILSLSRSAQPALSLLDLLEGQKVKPVKARVGKVQIYGLFIGIEGTKVSGLCHKSEVYVTCILVPRPVLKNEPAVRQQKRRHHAGSAQFLRRGRLDLERRCISFGLKPSHFTDEDFHQAADTSSEEDQGPLGILKDVETLSSGEDGDNDVDGKSSSEEGGGDHSEIEPMVVEIDAGAQGLAAKPFDVTPIVHDARPTPKPKGGFQWSGDISQEHVGDPGSSEDSDSDDQQPPSEKKRQKKGQVAQVDLTADIPRLSEVDEARENAKLALSTINFREEAEKLNIWNALMNLGNVYGTEESLESVSKDAARHYKPKTVHPRFASILESGKNESRSLRRVCCRMQKNSSRTCEKFGQCSKVWTLFGEHYRTRGDVKQAWKLLPRSLQSHFKTISEFAQLEYKLGESEQGRTLFEGIVDIHPKRWDVCSIYIDTEAEKNDMQIMDFVQIPTSNGSLASPLGPHPFQKPLRSFACSKHLMTSLKAKAFSVACAGEKDRE
ncbi:hypothetical protein BJY52DRAFT_1230456 [Lactarius psammicola]|nr:hypothetical protein BJY52DRAFT_1230456 [Lactarius psammicola]